jgi:CheY-like chemotaxis protein
MEILKEQVNANQSTAGTRIGRISLRPHRRSAVPAEEKIVAVVDGHFVYTSSNFRNAQSQAALALPAGNLEIKKTLAPKRVLVIEDNLDSVHSLALLLHDMGHAVEYAINGYVGLDMALRLHPDFVLLDLNLPGMDGFEVCRRIKQKEVLAHTRVIALTAFSQEEYRIRAKAIGCEMHLLKPVPIRVLEELLG